MLRTLITLVVAVIAAGQSLHAQPWLDQARADVSRLTARELAGRGWLFEGHRKAAEYIRGRFEQIGVEPLGGSYFQAFPVEARVLTSTPRLVIDGRALEFGRAFLPHHVAGAASTDEPVRIVDVGHGLFLPMRKINEFAAHDVEGALVVLRAAVPQEYTADTSIPRDFLAPEGRAYIASRLGARAVVILVDRLSFGGSFSDGTIPVFTAADSLFPKGARTAEFALEIETVRATGQNVIGRIPGRTTSDSTILLLAHYDHLGATDDSTWFPGANDNASGTALLLALARHFKENPARLPITLIAFSGEELGLVGSRFFAEQPTFPLERTRFLVNVDMAASGLEGIMAVGGVEFEQEWELLRRIGDSVGVGEVRKRANAPNSDHFFLVQRGVRGFYIYPFTGYQPYHHIDDRIETLQWQVFERLRAVLSRFVGQL